MNILHSGLKKKLAPRRLKPLVVCGKLQLLQWPEKGRQVVRLCIRSGRKVAWLRDSAPELPSEAEQAACRSREPHDAWC